MIVACALFMQNLDSTVIATALPTMARAFGSDPVHMNVALTSYLLSVAVFIPGERLGGGPLWHSDGVPGGDRGLHGGIGAVRAGGYAVVPGARAGAAGDRRGHDGPRGAAGDAAETPRNELVAAMAWLTTPALVGPVVGPPLGGFIVTYASWRWIFDINVPIGIIGIIAVSLFIEDAREPPPGRFDTLGLILSGVCLAGLMFGLETGGRGVVSPAVTWGLVAVGVAAGAGYLVHARTHANPLLDLSLMRLPCFGVAISAMLLFRIGIGAIPFLLPLMLQVGFGDSAVQSGLITFASSAGALIMKPVAQRALLWFGFRNTLVWNGVICAVMLAICAGFRPAWPIAAIYGALLVGGFFRSLQFTAYNTLAYGDVPRRKMSAATSLYTAAQQLAATIGISAGAVALEIAMGASGNHPARPWDFSMAFLVVSVFTVIAAPIALLMPATAGDDLAGRQPAPGRARGARAAEAD